MSQVSTVQVEDISEKSGVNQKGNAWTRWALKDGNGDWYSTFEKGVVHEGLKGQRVEVEWEQNGDYRNLLRATVQAAKPELGTGEYIKAKEPPSTQRGIHASVALGHAVAWCSVTEGKDVLSEHGVVKVAQVFFDWLTDRAEGNAVAGPTTSRSTEPEDVPI
jgi:hypothetical protein